MKNQLWLIGAGPMAVEYAKVLKALNVVFTIIGRSTTSAEKFSEKTGCKVIAGGLTAFLKTATEIPDLCIVATGVEALAENTIELLHLGCNNILCEKPGGLNKNQIEEVANLAMEKKANVLLAYNRRFYSSVLKAKEIIEQDGDVSSFHFEFTEWSHLIEPLHKAEGVKERWFLGNSTHVVDLAFYLGGVPRAIQCYTAGGLPWHPSASSFSGAGISEKGALFSYQANWAAPGRWSVEFLTRNHRLILRPLELLQIQKKGSIEIEPVNLDDKLDRDFKPGLFKQVEFFINGSHSKFCSIHAQKELVKIYQKMANY